MCMYKKITLTSELIALQPIIQPLLVAGLFMEIVQDPEGIGRRKVIHPSLGITTFQVFRVFWVFRVPPPHLLQRPLDVTKGKFLRDPFGHGVCVFVCSILMRILTG